MREYLDLLSDCLYRGETKSNRTGVDTLASTPVVFEHHMSKGFPLLTTKKMGMKSIAAELEMFIKGITDKQWLKDRGCNIWNEWANPKEVEKVLSTFNPYHDSPNYANKGVNDLGPIYGYQWRRFGKTYDGIQKDGFPPLYQDPCDQLANAIWKLKNKPDDRRMIISAWNPTQLHQMSLPPCHYSFVLQHINGKLSLNWSQRSCDFYLGIPFNIASYGLLLELIAKEVGMRAHMLTGNLIDVHLYKNHRDQARKQLLRTPRKLPKLILPEEVNIFDWNMINLN